MANYNGSLEAVDCHIHSVRYDMVLESCSRSSKIGPHQVTYDSVARLLSLRSGIYHSMLSYSIIMRH